MVIIMAILHLPGILPLHLYVVFYCCNPARGGFIFFCEFLVLSFVL